MLKTYNEDFYLSSPEEIERFRSFSNFFDKERKVEQEKYRSVLANYDLFIEEVAKFLKELGYKTTIECSIMLTYLLTNGYLSLKGKMTEEKPFSSTELTCSLGTNIVAGEGCCRNYAKFHQDVFAKLNFLSKLFYVYETEFQRRISPNKEANHVINLIPYNDTWYGFDTYNRGILYRFKTPLLLQEISTISSFIIRYKPYYELIRGESTIDEIKEKLKKYQELASVPTISPIYYEEKLKHNIRKRMMESEEQIQAFHEKTKGLKKEIVAAIARD